MKFPTTPALIGTTALMGFLSGALGFGAAWIVKPAEIKTVQVEVPAAVEEVDADELDLAQLQVAKLERELSTKEREVKELQAQIKKNPAKAATGGQGNGPSLKAQLATLKAELKETKEALALAVEEKDDALAQLRETTEMLEETEVKLAKVTVQRDDAREDALFNRWQDFVKGAQLTICDRGGRKKLGNCRETVAAAIATQARQSKFAHCLRSGQAQPTVRERESNNAMLPEFSQLLNEEKRQTKGWYVEYCDPTLPESNDLPLATGKLAPSSASQG